MIRNLAQMKANWYFLCIRSCMLENDNLRKLTWWCRFNGYNISTLVIFLQLSNIYYTKAVPLAKSFIWICSWNNRFPSIYTKCVARREVSKSWKINICVLNVLKVKSEKLFVPIWLKPFDTTSRHLGKSFKLKTYPRTECKAHKTQLENRGVFCSGLFCPDKITIFKIFPMCQKYVYVTLK